MSKGFNDIELIDLGFYKQPTDKVGEYYWEYSKDGVIFVTDQTNYEKEVAKSLYTLTLISEVSETTGIKESRDFTDIVRIFSRR